MNRFFVWLITQYQHWISPFKGFNCAHRVLHGGHSCSHAVKDLISKQGLIDAWPDIKSRFNACKQAYQELGHRSYHERADIPCDLPCDIAFGDCGGGESADIACNCLSELDFRKNNKSSRLKQLFFWTILVTFFVVLYLVYGRDIAYVYITDNGSQNLVTRFTQRAEPEVRVLVIENGQKKYTNIAKLALKDKEYRLTFEEPIASFDNDQLQVLDARINIAKELVVVGQVMEEFDLASKSQEGDRFAYRLRRRWHFWE